MSEPAPPSWESRLLTAVFCAALAIHVGLLSYHWTVPFMSGHEFRQSQTAITTYYIDRENNFSLLYETPILGKPWVSILMEVPLYEWSVVGVSRLTGWPHFIAARTVSAVCFYAMLPAVYLLLARLGVTRPRRLLGLAVVLTCPVYIYYTRAFLMDSMALAGSVWFLLAFVRTLDERSWGWLAVATVAGTIAALVKSAIFAVWLPPAALYAVWQMARDWRGAGGVRAAVRTGLWSVAAVAVALGLLRAWIVYTDPLKAAHDSAWIFTSEKLSQGNWGLFNFRTLFTTGTWRDLLGCWDQAVMGRWFVAAFVLAGALLAGVRWRVLGLAGLFLHAQLMFPLAYALQDYYFYAAALFLCGAIAFLLYGLLDAARGRAWLLLLGLAPFVVQLDAYRRHYWEGQKIWSVGGNPGAEVIRDLTPAKSVIVVAGADWAAMTPYYSQRRALMIRRGLEYDRGYLDKAFARLEGEDVSAVVLQDEARKNRSFIELVARRFDLDPDQPTFSWTYADVYVARKYRKSVQLRIESTRRYPQVTVPKGVADDLPTKGYVRIPETIAGSAFLNVRPAPLAMEFEYGLTWVEHRDNVVISAHPNSDLWIRPPAHAREIRWVFGIFDGAFAKPDARTNGVEFLIVAEKPDGSTRPVYRRLLDPSNVPADRGDQAVTVPYVPEPGEVLRFSTRPNDNAAFDWAYWAKIEVE